jgi:hypothetical protein
MESFFYTSNKKNAVVAGAMFSKIILIFLALYALFIRRCRDLCASTEQDSESVFVQYMAIFAIGTTIELVFSWGMILFGVHENSPTRTEEECITHDRKLTENQYVQYIIVSNIVEMAILGVYGIACLVMVPNECSDGSIKDSFCRTMTLVLTVCSLGWAIIVGLLHYENQVHTESVES